MKSDRSKLLKLVLTKAAIKAQKEATFLTKLKPISFFNKPSAEIAAKEIDIIQREDEAPQILFRSWEIV